VAGFGNDLVSVVETASDWTQSVLDRSMAANPGTACLYNSGASCLLSAVVGQLAGRPAAHLAAQQLFAPLGIDEFDWPAGPEGVTMGWGNLRLHPQDLARVGLLYLHQGRRDGGQIIPAEWVVASTTDWVADRWYEYGYQWWLDTVYGYAFMAGRFGRVAIAAPEHDLVIVFTARLPNTAAAVGVARWLEEWTS
jgi:CubicO group peptidase (beta-lactamase class C family)